MLFLIAHPHTCRDEKVAQIDGGTVKGRGGLEANQVIGEWASVSRMQIKTTPSFRNLICRWEERTLLHEPNGWLIASDCLTVCRSACLAVWQGRMWMWVWWTAETGKIWYASKLINELLPAALVLVLEESKQSSSSCSIPIYTWKTHTYEKMSRSGKENY